MSGYKSVNSAAIHTWKTLVIVERRGHISVQLYQSSVVPQATSTFLGNLTRNFLAMIANILTWSTISIGLVYTAVIPDENYWSLRGNIIHDEEIRAIGGSLAFEKGERTANDLLMTYKKRELDAAFSDPLNFLPARNFMEVIEKIEKSKVFEIIKKLPKGAVLHAHDTAFVSGDFVYNITFRNDLYICEKDNDMFLHFFESPPSDCDWKLLSDLRKNDSIADSLNMRIKEKMTMMVNDPDKAYPNNRAAWVKFNDIFAFITPMLTYKPVYEDHFYNGLMELYKDNILYLELRSTLPTLYDLNGTQYEPIELVGIYKDVVEKFKRHYPDFIGAKLIYSPLKTIPQDEIQTFIDRALEMKRIYPNFFAGFDLVGQEDQLYPLKLYADKLSLVKNDINMFFHAGETNWYGMTTDENLIDAVLLNTKRIGHGYAILKHPTVLDYVKKHKVAIEISPISNQVLGLVKDLRNHPASALFANGFPVVISNDDPGLWGSKGLSYDFYEAFIGIMSGTADIRALKQLAMNSIIYSSLSQDDKIRALDAWEKKWIEFIDYLNNWEKEGEHKLE